MSLTRPALTLGPGSRGVQEARRFVVGVCRDLGRDDLLECAELGVSELVSNAILHAAGPISVAVRGTREHPRVEVRDGSREPPRVPQPRRSSEPEPPVADPEWPAGMDGLDGTDLITVGRGLAMVARTARAWGAEIEEHGKVVWFAPADTIAEESGVRAIITRPDGLDRLPRPRDAIEVALLGLPLALLRHTRQHFHELHRELRLLALANADHYPLAHELSALFDIIDGPLRDSLDAGRFHEPDPGSGDTADLTLRLSRTVADDLQRLSDLLDLSDEFCRQERLLTLARSPEQAAFQRWFVAECIRQIRGADALSWSAPSSRPGWEE